jgi:hypothetical protein
MYFMCICSAQRYGPTNEREKRGRVEIYQVRNGD